MSSADVGDARGGSASVKPSLTGRRWGVVLGAGPGLGRSIALLMVRHGLGVTIAGRSGDNLDVLAQEITRSAGTPDAVSSLQLDLADTQAVSDALTDLARTRVVSCLAYNAARSGGPLLQAGQDELATSVAVNALSAVAAVGAVADSLEAAAGTVLLTGGGLALRPSSAAGVLSLGKSALRTVAFLLAQELAERNVRVRTLTVAGTIGSTPAFAADTVAEALWRAQDDAAIERVYSG